MQDDEHSQSNGLFSITRSGMQNGETFIPLFLVMFLWIPAQMLMMDSTINVRAWGKTDLWILAAFLVFASVYIFLAWIYRRHATMGPDGYREWVSFGPVSIWSETYTYSEIDSFTVAKYQRHGIDRWSRDVKLQLANGKQYRSFWFSSSQHALRHAQRLNALVKEQRHRETSRSSNDQPAPNGRRPTS